MGAIVPIIIFASLWMTVEAGITALALLGWALAVGIGYLGLGRIALMLVPAINLYIYIQTNPVFYKNAFKTGADLGSIWIFYTGSVFILLLHYVVALGLWWGGKSLRS